MEQRTDLPTGIREGLEAERQVQAAVAEGSAGWGEGWTHPVLEDLLDVWADVERRYAPVRLF